MKEFISNLGVIPSASGPMKIFCDNTSAIALAKESRFQKRTNQEMLQFHPGSSPGGRHRDLQDTYGSEYCRPTKPLPRAKHDQHQEFMVLESLLCNLDY